MEVIYKQCCGIDVHKKVIVACLMVGNKRETRNFGTMTAEIKELANWLYENNCHVVAMESTGVYWKPIYNVLETLGYEIIVANARHIKTVPGRKTDVKDAEWIADLLRHGLIRASYIPDREQREMRDIVRYRKSLIEERSREINRLDKILESANIKLSSLVSDITGTSSQNILRSLLKGSLNQDSIGTMLYGKLRDKRDELLKACDGVLTSCQKVLVAAILDHIADMTNRISQMDNFIDDVLKKHDDAVKKLQEIPGIAQRTSHIIVAELGTDMSRFPSAGHLAKWVGLCPGNNESAGKRMSGRTSKGNKTLKSALIQAAQVAVQNKDSFFKAQYDRLVVRRGANRAKVAVAHSILIAIYHMLKFNSHFVDLGVNYYHQFNTEKKISHYLNKLNLLGWAPITST